MKLQSAFNLKPAVILLAAVLIFFVGCSESPVDAVTSPSSSDYEAMKQLAEQDETIASFEPNYNEDDAGTFLSKADGEIYPLRVAQKMRVVNKVFTAVQIDDTTAEGTITVTFEGVLFIAATSAPDAIFPDTVIQKPFTTIVTRKIIFNRVRFDGDVQVDFEHRPFRGWRVAAISLPAGGTVNSGIQIKIMTLTLQNGEVIVIDSPNDYFVARGIVRWQHILSFNSSTQVDIQLELISNTEDVDYVTLTFGGNVHGMNRVKKLFELVSTELTESGYLKVYSQSFIANRFPGHFHAVVNAYSNNTVYTDTAPVENDMWGVPYIVQ
jgi:hypothetical protein